MPISTYRYYHRTLDVSKVLSSLMPSHGMTIARMIQQLKVTSTPALSCASLREMEERDVSAVQNCTEDTWSASTSHHF
jgi:hypothetical protein